MDKHDRDDNITTNHVVFGHILSGPETIANVQIATPWLEFPEQTDEGGRGGGRRPQSMSFKLEKVIGSRELIGFHRME